MFRVLFLFFGDIISFHALVFYQKDAQTDQKLAKSVTSFLYQIQFERNQRIEALKQKSFSNFMSERLSNFTLCNTIKKVY
jgi:hypothetical protein